MITVTIPQKTLDYIINVVTTAKLAGIDNIIIEQNAIRAIDDDKTVVIMHSDDIPKLPFDSIGLTRLGILLSRYDIASSVPGFSAEAVVDNSKEDEPSFVRSILFKSKGVKVDYRCANPQTIKAPKSINDTITHHTSITGAAVQMITKGQSAMAADEVVFIGDESGVSMIIKDVNNDELEYKFTDTNNLENDHEDSKFTHKYPIKVITPLFKQSTDSDFFISKKGMLNILVNNINIFVLPRSQ